MITLFEKMRLIRCFVFDMDGVLTGTKVDLINEQDIIRHSHVKDGDAIRSCIIKGYQVAIISAGTSPPLKAQLRRLGVENVYMDCRNKIEFLNKFCTQNNISLNNIAYMGDDRPDIECLKTVQLACCPQDAIWEIKSFCHYISPITGGNGCVRELIERVLTIQKNW